MPSVATPDYPALINPFAILPVSGRTPEMVILQIMEWPHWSDIRALAGKEYALSRERFETLLPEYQRFLALVMLGYGPVGMFSIEVDKVWHSHVLASHLWADFCLRLHGRMINHVPQIPSDHPSESDAVSSTCISYYRDVTKHKNSLTRSLESAQDFARAYFQTFGDCPPSSIWSLEKAEACASY